MNIDNFKDSIKACRFCFMCRHLSGVGNVTFSEADTPRVRASMIFGLSHNPDYIKNSDFIDTIYTSDVSAACRFHCVNHFDENGMVLAMRRDIVEAGLVPADVKAIADELISNAAAPEIKGTADFVYLSDCLSAECPSEEEAFAKIAKKAGVKYAVAQGCFVAKPLRVLGFEEAAKEAAKVFVDALNAAKVKTIVTSNTAAFDGLKNDVKDFGLKLDAKVMHVSEFVASLKIKFSKKAGKVFYLESDYLKNYNDSYKFPKTLLSQMKASCADFGTNNEESYTCGEGAIVLAKLRPAIVKKMAEYVAARADDPQNDVFAVASPYTKIQLSKHTPLKVMTITELAASCL